MGLLTARGQQRTDSTHVLAAIRVMNRLALVTETLRAALNTLATVAPDWLQGLAPLAWYARYSKRIEDTRLPQGQAKRDAYAQTVGEDGFHLLDALDAPETPEGLRELPIIATLRQTWQRHYERATGEVPPSGHPAVSRVRFKANRDLPPAAGRIESSYDPGTRYRQKCDTEWTGYMVHVSETCEPTAPHLLTHVHTTTAAVYEAQCTAPIHAALEEKIWRRGTILSMAPASVRTCSLPAGMSTGSPCAALRGRSKGGRPIPRGPPISPSARWIGNSSRLGARRERSRPSGGSMSIARASPIPLCASAFRTAVPVTPGRCASGPRRLGAACICRRRSALKRSRRRGPGMPVRRGGNAIN